MGAVDDFVAAALGGKADAVSMADVLHYQRLSVADIREAALAANLPVRRF